MNRFHYASGLKTALQIEKEDLRAIVENLDFLHDNYHDKEKVAGLPLIIKNQCDRYLATAKGDDYVKMSEAILLSMESKTGTGILAAKLRRFV